MNSCRSLALLGPEGSFSEKAANYFCHKSKKVFVRTIPEVISEIEAGHVDFGIVPFENSIGGSVWEVGDLIFTNQLYISEMVVLPITQSLAALPNHGKIEIVLSHPQGFLQSASYLKKYLPTAKRVEVGSTSAAFKKISQEKLTKAAAIGPAQAGEIYGLEILAKSIEDNKNNKTRFALISKNLQKNTGTKTSIVISPKKDKPGLLFEILRPFRDQNINLCRIESRPSREKLGTYVFHLEFDANYWDRGVQAIIEEIAKSNRVSVLGCYEQKEIL